MSTLRDEGIGSPNAPRPPWDTPDVGNTEDALGAQAQIKRHERLIEEQMRKRDEAIRKMRNEDGMTYIAIAQQMGMTERNVHFIVKGDSRSGRVR